MSARIRAFLLHLGASLAIIALFFAVLRGAWYPGFYFELEGVWVVARMVILVTLVVGPLLTLLVYDLRKGLKVVQRDVAVILLLQLLALGWGVRASYLGQPDYLAFVAGQFSTISRHELVGENSDAQFAASSWEAPLPVYIRPVADAQERSEQIWAFLEGRAPDLQYQFDRYLPYREHRQTIAAAGREVAAVVADDAERRARFDAFLANHGGRDSDYLLYTVFAHEREGTLVLSRDGVEPVAFLDMILE